VFPFEECQGNSLETNIEEVYRTGTYVEDWSCGLTKSILSGDRFFVVKVGTDKRNDVKGIVGSGFVIKERYKKQSVQDPTKEVLHVDLRFDNLLNPYKEDILFPLPIFRVPNKEICIHSKR